MSEFVTVEVHTEFAKRIEEENGRQNHRLTILEESVKDINKISLNVERLAANIEAMTNEIKRQGDRLTAIEEKPAKRWDVVITGALSAIVGALMAAMMSGLIR